MSRAPQVRHPAPVRRYHVETWGCQMNVHDSEKLAGALEREGYVRAGSAGEADVVLLNTCSIREKAAEKVFGELGRLARLKSRRPGMLLGVCGCVAQQEGERIFSRAPYVDFVLGPRAVGSLPAILGRLRGGGSADRIVDTEYREDSIRFPYDKIRREGAGTGKAFVTVIEGCNHRCTYCIVPRTRGPEVLGAMDDVLAEVRSLADTGYVEVEFLGQTVNAYRDAEGNTLAELLRATAGIEGIRRIRFTTSHPAQMTDRLMDAMADARPRVCRFLHLPVQSGSTEILRRMRRGYDRDTYLTKIDALRRRIPDLCFGTDVIVGYPGETEADFRETLTLLEEVAYDSVYSFTYSPRPGTVACGLDDAVPQAESLERLHRLQELQKTIQARRNQDRVDGVVEVLVSGRSKRDPSRWTGRTEENRVVNFRGESGPGRLQPVRIVHATPYSLVGRSLA